MGSVVASLFFEMCLSFFGLINQASTSFKRSNLIYQIERNTILLHNRKMETNQMQEINKITEKVIACAIEVHKHLKNVCITN